MALFKLTLNQPEINANDILLITHHNKIIVRSADEEYARELADEAIKEYVSDRVAQGLDENDKPISPWLKSNLVICQIYKGPKYQRQGEEEVVYPPDLMFEYEYED